MTFTWTPEVVFAAATSSGRESPITFPAAIVAPAGASPPNVWYVRKGSPPAAPNASTRLLPSGTARMSAFPSLFRSAAATCVPVWSLFPSGKKPPPPSAPRRRVDDVDRRAAPCVEPVDDLVAARAGRVARGHECAVPPRSVRERQQRLDWLEARAVEDAQLRPCSLARRRHDLRLAVAVHVAHGDPDAVLVGRVRRECDRVVAPGRDLECLLTESVPPANVGPAGVLPGDDADRLRCRRYGGRDERGGKERRTQSNNPPSGPR